MIDQGSLTRTASSGQGSEEGLAVWFNHERPERSIEETTRPMKIEFLMFRSQGVPLIETNREAMIIKPRLSILDLGGLREGFSWVSTA